MPKADDLIEIRIPLIVTADGKWAAQGSHLTVGEPDWAFVDEMCDFDNPTVNPQRYWITAYVKQQRVGEIPGVARRDDNGCPQETTVNSSAPDASAPAQRPRE